MARKGDDGKHPWVFTQKRKVSLRKAQQTHVYLVRLGEKAKAKGMKL